VKDGKIRETLVEDMSLWHLSMLIIEKLLSGVKGRYGQWKAESQDARDKRGRR
jgi:hypothetical protein